MHPFKIFFCCGLLCLTSALPLESDSSKPQSSQFTERHSCKVFPPLRSSSNGFVPYTITRYSCQSLTPSLYMNVTCEDRCRDPVKNKYLSKRLYKVEPVTYFKRFESQFDGTIDKELTLSCRCVATEKGKRRSRGRGKKRRERRRQQTDGEQRDD